jgi:predicted kinase
MFVLRGSIMGRIIFIRGLPGSGKSTHSKNYIEQNPNIIRVNKDDIRALMGYTKFNKQKEKLVVECEYNMAQEAITRGFDVLVDDTNLNPYHKNRYENLARMADAEFEIIEIDTPIEECIRRDSLRERSVGEEVIRNMAKKWGVE